MHSHGESRAAVHTCICTCTHTGGTHTLGQCTQVHTCAHTTTYTCLFTQGHASRDFALLWKAPPGSTLLNLELVLQAAHRAELLSHVPNRLEPTFALWKRPNPVENGSGREKLQRCVLTPGSPLSPNHLPPESSDRLQCNSKKHSAFKVISPRVLAAFNHRLLKA